MQKPRTCSVPASARSLSAALRATSKSRPSKSATIIREPDATPRATARTGPRGSPRRRRTRPPRSPLLRRPRRARRPPRRGRPGREETETDRNDRAVDRNILRASIEISSLREILTILIVIGMGLTQNRSGLHLPGCDNQAKTSVASHTTCSNDNNNLQIEIEAIDELVTPILIPHFHVSVTPFQRYATPNVSTCVIPNEDMEPLQESSCQEEITESEDSREAFQTIQRSWLEVIYHSSLFNRILSYVGAEDDFSIMRVNHRFYSEIYVRRLLGRENNWMGILAYLNSKPQLTQMYEKLKQNEEESQHSLDLDRTESFFQTQADDHTLREDQMAKLDRVMKALAAFRIPYSQGVNSIVATLLFFFPEDVSFWVTVNLLYKTHDIHNNSDVYSNFMSDLEQLVAQYVPQVAAKLDSLDFNIQYFAMKWIMGLFAYDLPRQLLFDLWDIMLSFDALLALKMFIISLFEHLEPALMAKNQGNDQVNFMLKHELKSLLANEVGAEVLKKTRQHLVWHKYGENFTNFYEMDKLQPAIKYTSTRKPSTQNNFLDLLNSPSKEQPIPHILAIPEEKNIPEEKGIPSDDIFPADLDQISIIPDDEKEAKAPQAGQTKS